jgi:hypothetical protein
MVNKIYNQAAVTTQQTEGWSGRIIQYTDQLTHYFDLQIKLVLYWTIVGVIDIEGYVRYSITITIFKDCFK